MKVRKNGDTIFPYKPSKFPYQTSEQSETMTGEGDGELYMPDIDINSMFLRYDNRLNRKRYILRSITVAVAVIGVPFPSVRVSFTFTSAIVPSSVQLPLTAKS